VALTVRLAWRNVWRNPRRTALTVAATVFAVVLVVFFVALAAGLHGKMIEDAVRVHSGHVTIMGQGYLENRTLEQFIRLDAPLQALLQHTPGIRGYAPRVIGFGLLSKDAATQGIAVFGVDPRREATVTTLPERVRQGAFLSPNGHHQIVLGQRLAENLGAQIGDELLLYSVAYSLEAAYELFSVAGVMQLPEPVLDRSVAVISLQDAQDFFAYDDRVTEVAILARDTDSAPALAATLRRALAHMPGEGAEVHTWRDVMPELQQFIFLDDAGMYMLLVILVIVVGFGILNTILMAVLERRRELGVVLALGLSPGALFRLVYLESMFLAGAGLALGLAAGIPLVLYFVTHPVHLTGAAAGALEVWGIEPVMTWKLKPLNPIGSTITILGVAAVAAFYPALKASRARPVEALRSI
jgi:putative ABC transport system permease protein